MGGGDGKVISRVTCADEIEPGAWCCHELDSGVGMMRDAMMMMDDDEDSGL